MKVEKSVLAGEVDIPASKSHTIRGVAVASMGNGVSTIYNPLISSDALSAVKCYRALGAEIDTSDDQKWIIKGTGGKIKAPDDVIDVGNSGTTLRIALGSASLVDENVKILFTGDQQIQNRPVARLLNSLNELGVKAISVKNNGKAPVEISGKLKGGRTEIECVTSQFLSSLLLACPLAEGDSVIDVSLLNEPDYVRITMDWLEWQEICFKFDEDLKHFEILGGQSYQAFEKRIPADFSSATFFLCAGSFLEGSDILIKGLDFSDSQPDKAVVDYLRLMGADITAQEDGIRVKASKLKGCEIDMNRTPDALPAMAVTAAFSEGQTRLYNVSQARVKETDRIDCMAKELAKLGADVEQLSDGMVISPSKCAAGDFEGYHDHRIVMAMALAGMGCEGVSTITSKEAIDVTFPGFPKVMKGLGGKIEW